MIIEVCIESKMGIKVAQKFNLDRIEICRDLNQDGLTPKIEIQESAKEIFIKDRFIMIRPHNNGFVYNENEIIKMKRSISLASEYQPKGVVFGGLTKDCKIDFKKNEELLLHAKSLNLECTFHRAFDSCIEPIQSFKEIKALGFDWLLTSGQEFSAENGIPLLKKLNNLKNDKIKILAGGGISPNNCHKFKLIELDGIHFSIDKNQTVEQQKIKNILNQLSIN